MKCPKCNSELIWGGDHTYEDYGFDGEGVVSNHSCPNSGCTVDMVLIYDEMFKPPAWHQEILKREIR